jgi:hypothetical protein
MSILPEQTILPMELFDVRLPEELNGERKAIHKPGCETETYIVPQFLKSCRTAIAYTRVSTPAQARNSSFARQRKSCEDFAQCAGLEIVQYYEEVESGITYAGRPLLQNALADIETGRAQVLLVESMDRLHREQSVGNRILERLITARCHLICCEVQRVGSPEYDFALTISHSAHIYKIELLQELGCI